ncbi:MAG: hypothetical protein AAFR84_00875 [Pseudomonadota bacterium]
MHSIRTLMTEALSQMEALRGEERRAHEDALEKLREAVRALPPEERS